MSDQPLLAAVKPPVMSGSPSGLPASSFSGFSSSSTRVLGNESVGHVRIWLRGIVDMMPIKGSKEVKVTAVEYAPEGSRHRETSDMLPASYDYPGGFQDSAGRVVFEKASFVEFDLRRNIKGWNMRFNVKVHGKEVAFAQINHTDLLREQEWMLLLQHSSSFHNNPVYGPDTIEAREDVGTNSKQKHAKRQGLKPARRPAFLSVLVEVVHDSALSETPKVPKHLPHATVPGWGRRRQRAPGGRTRVMMITRGTRGDVQPFVALARGLIQNHNCEVTIVTEIVWKSFVKDGRADLPDGTLHFRPSGGDSMYQTRQFMAQYVTWMGQYHDSLQSFVFANQEANFFPSEGCIYHWAVEELPDFLVFGFTMTHIAMIVSEALGVPIVGFLLQPDRKVEERTDVLTLLDKLKQPVRKAMNSSEFSAAVTQIMEKTGGVGQISLNTLRTTRGLHPCPSDIADSMRQYEECAKFKVPLIVPITPMVLSDSMLEELDGTTFTNFIFLRMSVDKVSSDVEEFINRARRDGRVVFLMTFSSMPVGERNLLAAAMQICNKMEFKPMEHEGQYRQGTVKPAVIAMVGGQEHMPATLEQMKEAERLEKEGQLFIARKGQPFGALFPMVDVVISQGGLGVTSEALRAGIAVITSGILLLDQRWWGARIKELGVGPGGMRVNRLLALLKKGHDLGWRERVCDWRHDSKLWSKKWHDKYEGDLDGVTVNAKEVFEAGTRKAAIIESAYEQQGCSPAMCRQARCCARSLYGFIRCLLLANLPRLLYVIIVVIGEILCCGRCRSRAATYCAQCGDDEEVSMTASEPESEVSVSSGSGDSGAELV